MLINRINETNIVKITPKMDQLPVEIIENILKSSTITVEDIISFSSACSYFRNIVINSQTIWKQKFYHNWPELIDLCSNTYTDYFREIQYIYALKERTCTLLYSMPPRFHRKFELSDTDLQEWDTLICEKEQNYYYITAHLMEIVNTNVPIKSIEVVPLSTPGNKTTQYYATKVLRYMRQMHLSKNWTDFINRPQREQILEKGAIFVAQWCQPNTDVSYKKIAAKLDDIAETVKRHLFLINPSHQLFKASPESLALWRVANLDGNQWDVAECRQLLVAMRDVIYGELGFAGNKEAYYLPQNSLINEVLETKRGIPITLAIIYESIGRRLGLVFEPISFPAHFLLRFTETATSWYYIDVFNDGNIVRKNSCAHSRSPSLAQKNLFAAATAAQVVERMANNLEMCTRQNAELRGRVTRLRSVLELLKLVSPQDLTALLTLAKFYMLHEMNTRLLENYLTTQTFNAPNQAERILHMLRDFSNHHEQNEWDVVPVAQPSPRTPNLKYAIGMTMQHLMYNYKCVIYDWDARCLATAKWQAEMEVHQLTLKTEQPFYHVLVEDGSYRYVAQESFVPTTHNDFLHSNEELGRHFSHFFENHFVPNAEKELVYPDDTKVRHKFYQDMNLLNYQP